MRKRTPKLSLNRETLRRLETDDLQAPRGGTDTLETSCPHCDRHSYSNCNPCGSYGCTFSFCLC